MKNIIRRKGLLTKKQSKRVHGSSDAGMIKDSKTCQASALKKALTIYPRAYKTMPDLYNAAMSQQANNFSSDSVFKNIDP